MRSFLLVAGLFLTGAVMAQDITMPREQWLSNLKPTMRDGFCRAGSPFMQAYKGDAADCPGTVEALFAKCTTDVPQVVIPDPIVGVPQATKYGSIVGECVSAHYMGGEILEIFFMMQDVTNQGPATGG